jgi:hypothetical protein
MAPPIDGVELKLERARRHLDDLVTQIDAYLDENDPPFGIRVETDDLSAGRRVQRLVAEVRRPPPAEWGAIIGDWANNLRTALDYVIYELARLETGADDPDGTKFPIVKDRANWPDQSRSIGKIAAGWRDVVESLQPFNAMLPEADGLAMLAAISNRDKHRVVHAVAGSISRGVNRVTGANVVAVHSVRQFPGEALKDGDLVVEVDFDHDGPDVRIEGTVGIDVVLETMPLELREMMTDITDRVTDVIDRFRAPLA